ncbi:MAG: hypothetical protein BVN35_02300 [Proteobacteria bacterium ST_bin11]|nr:MAG: hypothetical protein BVN35_02300 [Proteobacteria bacterium ST_bin11]
MHPRDQQQVGPSLRALRSQLAKFHIGIHFTVMADQATIAKSEMKFEEASSLDIDSRRLDNAAQKLLSKNNNQLFFNAFSA